VIYRLTAQVWDGPTYLIGEYSTLKRVEEEIERLKEQDKKSGWLTSVEYKIIMVDNNMQIELSEEFLKTLNNKQKELLGLNNRYVLKVVDKDLYAGRISWGKPEPLQNARIYMTKHHAKLSAKSYNNSFYTFEPAPVKIELVKNG
jgi:hypothetical protein